MSSTADPPRTVLHEEDVKTVRLFYLRNFLFLYLIYRIAITLVMTFFVGSFTSLADSRIYFSGDPVGLLSSLGWRTFLDKEDVVKFLGGSARIVLQLPVLVNLLFSIVAFVGIRELVLEIAPKRTLRGYLLLSLLLLPSFNLWSSLLGKDSLITFAGGIIAARMIRYLNTGKMQVNLRFLVSIYLMFVIKPQYIPAIVQFFLYLWVIKKIGLRKGGAAVLAVLVILINVAIVYYFRDYIDFYSRNLFRYFDPTARSTRPNPFTHKYDVFRLLPYGLFIGLWGPTVAETRISFLHLFSFIESGIIFLMWGLLLFQLVKNLIVRMAVQTRRTFVILNSTLWFLVMQYMQGILNPGSAIRYRTNVFLFLLAFVHLAYSTGYIRVKRGQKEVVERRA